LHCRGTVNTLIITPVVAMPVGLTCLIVIDIHVHSVTITVRTDTNAGLSTNCAHIIANDEDSLHLVNTTNNIGKVTILIELLTVLNLG